MNFLFRKPNAEYYYDDQFLYAKKGEEVYKLALFDQHFYKLRLVNGIAILEIDGLRMHLTKDFKTPLDYSKEVLKNLKVKSTDIVLDTCLGLGYTALEASKFAKHVVTCEISQAVLSLAKWNPWSEGLFESEKIDIFEADSSEKIKEFETGSFNVIIHDPPRLSTAESLYYLPFYKELYRVLKKSGRLFHYVGSLGSKNKGRSIEKEVARRLGEAGFKQIKYNKKLQGVFAIK